MLKLLVCLLCLWIGSAQAAVVLQYHHVSETSPRVTSVTPAEFRSHMQFLADNGFEVVPLVSLVEALQRGEAPPLRAVAISFDDGYQNIADEAVPILKEYGFPYTLFVAAEPLTKKQRGMMSTETLMRLAAEGAHIANHSFGHEHLVRRLAQESPQQWRERVRRNLLDTEAALAQIRGQHSLPMLAYPYGEYNAELQTLVRELGMVAFGQQSGAMGKYSDLSALPRFPLGGKYASLASLKDKLYSLPMPVIELSPADPLLVEDFRPKLTVTLADSTDMQIAQMRCYLPGEGAVVPNWTDKVRFEVQASSVLPPGRSRYNCTAPSKSMRGFYWFSQAWLRPNDDGSWPKEP